MKERTNDAMNIKTININGREIPLELNLHQSYTEALKEFVQMRELFLELVGITERNTDLYHAYFSIMEHYLRNGGAYIMDSGNFKSSTAKEIQECKNDYKLFVKIMIRLTKTTKEQKLSFLKQMKDHHDTPQKISDKTENPIHIMDRVLSSVEKHTKKNKTVKIAGEEISALLDVNEDYAIAIEKFEFLRKICLAKLGVIRENPSLHKPYKKILDHYLRNSASYIMDRHNFEDFDEKTIAKYKQNYKLFMSVVFRIVNLTEEQKIIFLEKLKAKYDATKQGSTGIAIHVMDQILSSI